MTKIRDRERRLFELIDGVLVEKVMGYWESVLAIELAGLLRDFLKGKKLGTLAGEAGMLRLSPGLVRIPDLSFISRARLAHHRRARAPILPIAPDLAIEVLSEGNTPRELCESRFQVAPPFHSPHASVNIDQALLDRQAIFLRRRSILKSPTRPVFGQFR